MLATRARLSGLTLVTTQNVTEEILVVHEEVNLSMVFTHVSYPLLDFTNDTKLISQTFFDFTRNHFVGCKVIYSGIEFCKSHFVFFR
jgi:hypothetical protein